MIFDHSKRQINTYLSVKSTSFYLQKLEAGLVLFYYRSPIFIQRIIAINIYCITSKTCIVFLSQILKCCIIKFMMRFIYLLMK